MFLEAGLNGKDTQVRFDLSTFRNLACYNLLFPTPQISTPGLFMFFPTKPEPADGTDDFPSSLMIREEVFLSVSSASRSIRLSNSSQEGMS